MLIRMRSRISVALLQHRYGGGEGWGREGGGRGGERAELAECSVAQCGSCDCSCAGGWLDGRSLLPDR